MAYFEELSVDIDELTDVENDPYAAGDAEEMRAKILRPIKEDLESLIGKIEEAEKEVEKLREKCQEFLGSLPDESEEDAEDSVPNRDLIDGTRDIDVLARDAMDRIQEAHHNAASIGKKCGRRFFDVSLEDELARWASCAQSFPELAVAVETQQEELERAIGRNEMLEKENDRLQSKQEALGPLLSKM